MHPEPAGAHLWESYEKNTNHTDLPSTKLHQTHGTTVKSWGCFTLVLHVLLVALSPSSAPEPRPLCRHLCGLPHWNIPLMSLGLRLLLTLFSPLCPAVLCSPRVVLLRAQSFCRPLYQGLCWAAVPGGFMWLRTRIQLWNTFCVCPRRSFGLICTGSPAGFLSCGW